MATRKNASEITADATNETTLNGSQNPQCDEEQPIKNNEVAADDQAQAVYSSLLAPSQEDSLEETDLPEETVKDALVESVLIPGVDLSKLSEDERRNFGELISKLSYRGPSVSKASKKEMRAMLAEGTRIHTRTGEVAVETDAKKLKKDMVELAASANSKGKRILRGKISGIREIDSASDVKQYLARVAFGNETCQVLIPDFVLFHYDYNQRLDPETQKKVYGTMRSMIGSEIDFVVKHWDAKERIAYGDRLKAMERLGWNYFLNEKNPDHVIKDMIVEATVIAVRQRYLMVNALGVDTRIPIEECCWAHYTDLRDHYKNNDVIAAKVLDISTTDTTKAANEKYTLVGLELSIRRTTKDPREKYWDEYKENGLYMARVTAVDPNGAGVFILLENRTPALCAYPTFGALPEVGDERIVEITEKTVLEKKGVPEHRIFGVFKKV